MVDITNRLIDDNGNDIASNLLNYLYNATDNSSRQIELAPNTAAVQMSDVRRRHPIDKSLLENRPNDLPNPLEFLSAFSESVQVSFFLSFVLIATFRYRIRFG